MCDMYVCKHFPSLQNCIVLFYNHIFLFKVLWIIFQVIELSLLDLIGNGCMFNAKLTGRENGKALLTGTENGGAGPGSREMVVQVYTRSAMRRMRSA